MELFSEVENLLCDLRPPLSLSEAPFPGLLSEQLAVRFSPVPACPHHCTVCNSSVGWFSHLAFACHSPHSAWSIAGAQLSLVGGASECTIEGIPRAFLFPGLWVRGSLCREHCPRSSLLVELLILEVLKCCLSQQALPSFSGSERITGAPYIWSEALCWHLLQSNSMFRVTC